MKRTEEATSHIHRIINNFRPIMFGLNETTDTSCDF